MRPTAGASNSPGRDDRASFPGYAGREVEPVQAVFPAAFGADAASARLAVLAEALAGRLSMTNIPGSPTSTTASWPP